MSSNVFFTEVWVTNRCNYSCRYCYEKDITRQGDLSQITADYIIDFIKKNILKDQRLIVNIHGGEPTLNFDIIKYLVKNIKEKITNHSDFGITTNASLLDKESINFLIDNFKYDISLSIDGKKETHNYNRITNHNVNYDTIIKNALAMLKLRKNLRIRLTYDRNNISLLAENIIYLIELGFKQVVPIPDFVSTDWTSKDFNIIKKEYTKIKKYLEMNNLHDYLFHEIDKNFVHVGKCSGGINHYSIDTDGNIYPCTYVVKNKRFIIGNVNGEINVNKLNKFIEIYNKKVNECIDCKLYDYCVSTRCYFLNYITTGDYYKPNLVECNMLNIRYELVTEI